MDVTPKMTPKPEKNGIPPLIVLIAIVVGILVVGGILFVIVLVKLLKRTKQTEQKKKMERRRFVDNLFQDTIKDKGTASLSEIFNKISDTTVGIKGTLHQNPTTKMYDSVTYDLEENKEETSLSTQEEQRGKQTEDNDARRSLPIREESVSTLESGVSLSGTISDISTLNRKNDNEIILGNHSVARDKVDMEKDDDENVTRFITVDIDIESSDKKNLTDHEKNEVFVELEGWIDLNSKTRTENSKSDNNNKISSSKYSILNTSFDIGEEGITHL